MEQIFLSRRNLLTLLAKLDRNKESPGASASTVVKFQNPTDPFVQTMDAIAVTAVEDEDYYEKRNAGPMHPSDEATIASGTYSEPDVHTRDAPTPQPDALFTGHPPLTGRTMGHNMREAFMLDVVDAVPLRTFTTQITDDVYSVSSSFFRGMFEESILAAGSRDAFFEKYRFVMRKQLHDILVGVVVGTLLSASIQNRT